MMWIVTVVVLLCWSKVLFLMLPSMGFMMPLAVPDQWYPHMHRIQRPAKKVAFFLNIREPADGEATVGSVHPAKEEVPT